MTKYLSCLPLRWPKIYLFSCQESHSRTAKASTRRQPTFKPTRVTIVFLTVLLAGSRRLVDAFPRFSHINQGKGKSNNCLTPWFPMRQIGALRLLRRYCTKLRHRIILWIVQKGRAAVFLSFIEARALFKSRIRVPKSQCHDFLPDFTIFRL